MIPVFNSIKTEVVQVTVIIQLQVQFCFLSRTSRVTYIKFYEDDKEFNRERDSEKEEETADTFLRNIIRTVILVTVN